MVHNEQGPVGSERARARMPAEWARHRRCWMAWPSSEVAFGSRLEIARELYAEIAQTIRRFEPVTMITRPDQVASASLMCGQGISILPIDIDDSWTRDTGPTFVLDTQGALIGVDWQFNGWGGLNPDHSHDAKLARTLNDHLGVGTISSDLVTEGGSICVDGQGTAIVCRAAILDEQRNPGLSEADVEAELGRCLGVEKTIWLPNSHIDDETAGHVDNLACFSAPGKVLALACADQKDPNHRMLEENLDVLRAASDAAGRSLEVRAIMAPEPGYRDDGRRLTLSYINFYMAGGEGGGGIIMPGFNDAADLPAFKSMQEAFPDREVVQMQVRDLIHGGGGIHCITQQQPWSAMDS